MIAVEEHTNANSARSGSGSNSCPPWRDEGGMKLRHPRPDHDDNLEHQEVDFLWKQGPSPPPLKGRPSLGLIRTGQVRILSKQLAEVGRGGHAKACEEGAASTLGQEDREQACGAPRGGGCLGAASHGAQEPPMSLSPPPPAPPVGVVTPPPLPMRRFRGGGGGGAGGGGGGDGGSSSSKGRLLAKGGAGGSSGRDRLAAQGHFWLAKAGLGRKKPEVAGAAAAASSVSAPVSPVRGAISAWSKGGGTRTPPPKYVSAAATGGAAASDGSRVGGRYRFPTWGSGKKLS